LFYPDVFPSCKICPKCAGGANSTPQSSRLDLRSLSVRGWGRLGRRGEGKGEERDVKEGDWRGKGEWKGSYWYFFFPTSSPVL